MSTLLSLIVAFTAAAAQDEAFKFDAWDAWNAFGEGASVTFEMKMKNINMTSTKSIKKKEGKVITLSTESTMLLNGKEYKNPAKEDLVKKPDKPTDPNEMKACTKCSEKHKKPEIKSSKEKLTINGIELDCVKNEIKAFDCEGNPYESLGTVSMWYSKDVPGWIVKMKTKTMDMTLTQFEKK